MKAQENTKKVSTPKFFVVVETPQRFMRFKVNGDTAEQVIEKLHTRISHRQPNKDRYNVCGTRREAILTFS